MFGSSTGAFGSSSRSLSLRIAFTRDSTLANNKPGGLSINTSFGGNAATAPAQTTTSTSLFGQSNTNNPTQPTTSTSTSLFGQTAQAQPATTGGSSLFGQSAAAPSSFSFGNAPKPAAVASTNLNPFGGGGSFMSTSLQPTNAFQQSLQQPQSMNVSQAPVVNSLLQDFDSLMAAYNPSDARCRFRHPFYNLVSSDDAPRFVRPQSIPEGLWNDAKAASPDPSCMVPVFACSFSDLQKRVEHQSQQSLAHKAKLEEIQLDLDQIQQKQQVDTNGRLLKCQREHIRLSQKIMHMVQLLRSRGHTNLTPEEEELRSLFEHLMAQLQQPAFRSRVDHIKSEVQAIQSAQQRPPESRRPVTFEVADEQTLNDIFRVLKETQHGLTQLTQVLQHDLRDAQLISRGYQRPAQANADKTSSHDALTLQQSSGALR